MKKRKREATENRKPETLPEIRPVSCDRLLDWLNSLRNGSEDQEGLDCIDELLDIVTDYKMAQETKPPTSGVIRRDARTLICSTCSHRVIIGDTYCGGCGKKLTWNIRGGLSDEGYQTNRTGDRRIQARR